MKPLDILLIEDRMEDVDLTREALREGQIENRLSVIHNGLDALFYLKEEKDDARAHFPDVIILDLNLPKKNGLEVLEEIQADQRLNNIPVIILSTSGASADLLNTYRIHPDRYIKKSSDFEALIKCMRSIQSATEGTQEVASDDTHLEFLNILLLEDNLADVDLLHELFFIKEKYDWRLVHMSRLKEALEYLQKNPVDLVILDLFLPDSQGLETLRQIHLQRSDLPIVVLTGLKNENVAIEAVRQGAQDFLVKGQITSNMFTRSIQYAIERKHLEILKDELVGYVNHELSNPLATMIEGVRYVVEGNLGPFNKEQQLFLETALTSMYRLRDITEMFLDKTKLELGKLNLEKENFDLIKLCEEIIQTFQPEARQKGIEIQTGFSAPEVLLCADRGRIVQVFLNLLSNAIKFAEQGIVTVAVREDNDAVEFSVADTGPGIATEFLPHIFSKFERCAEGKAAKVNGLGLGLFICKELVKLHKGKISVESELGKGTTFRVQLPKQVK